MPSSLIHFAAWWALFAALPLIWALRAHSAMRRDERVFRLMLIASPLLMLAIWLHGVLLEPPLGWTEAEPQRFVEVWFHARTPAFYAEHARELLAVAAPALLIASFLAYRGSRLVDHAWNRRTAAISFGLQVAGWLLLHPVASALVRVGEALRAQPLASALGSEAQQLAFVFGALPILAIAFMFARLSIEASARKKSRAVARPQRVPPPLPSRRAEPRRA